MRAWWALLGAWVSSVAAAGEWPAWRGPEGTGVSDETGLVDRWSPQGENLLWTLDLAGRGTPVVWGDRVYVWGYEPVQGDIAEVLLSVDLASGKVLWKKIFRDFLSDNIYERYSIGAPTVDPATGDVFLETSAGELVGFAPDGTERWRVSMMELLGRLTFPNGRTGSPVIVEDLVIVHGITSNWGREGLARDRYYAFDKRNGTLVWASQPGVQPQDYSWSTPIVAERDGRKILYGATGSGELVALDARTGEALWRSPIANGGVNTSPVLVGDLLIGSHAVENYDSTKTGGMFAVNVTTPPEPAGEEGAPLLRTFAWRADIDALSSSPVVVDGVIYQVNQTGDLYAVDAANGQILWMNKLGPDQLHASPIYADGKLYVPLFNGTFHVLKVSRAGMQVVSQTTVDGNAIGAPAVAHGRILLHTTKHLYCFGTPAPIPAPTLTPPKAETPGAPALLRVRPAEVVLRPGESVPILVDVLDAKGRFIRQVAPESVTPWIPPTAKVKSEMRATWGAGKLTAPADAGLTAGAFQVKVGGLIGTFRGRTVSGVPYRQDFEGFAVTEPDAKDPSARFGWPPLPWIGARFKWDVRERDGSKVLAKTLDRILFQRSMVFIGHPDERDYTMSVDVMSDGDSRQMAAVGVIHQRYIIAIKGNQRKLEVSSNQERLKVGVPFEMKPGVWYRLTTSVTVGEDGVATIRAKAWPRSEPEPAAWTIEVKHAYGHTQGAPGIFGFTPQNLHKVYLDDIVVAPAGGTP